MKRNFMGIEYETSPDVPDSIYDEVEKIITKEAIKNIDASYSDFVETRKEAIEYLKKLEEK